MNQLYQAEGFYNFKELCCAVLHQDLAAADDTLERQSSFLFAQGSCPVEAMRIFLTSMNRSIYNYLLYAQDLSLHKCCFQNLWPEPRLPQQGRILFRCPADDPQLLPAVPVS